MSLPARQPGDFFPSNSCHGDAFESMFCHRCAAYFGGYCRILLRAVCDGRHDKWRKAETPIGGECLNFKERGEARTAPRRPKVNKLQGQLL